MFALASMLRWRTRMRARWGVWVWVAALASGCCRVGATECRGRTLFACEDDFRGGSEWKERTTCESVCVVANDAAFCAEHDGLDATCDPSDADASSHCDGNAVVQCRNGYRTKTLASCEACAALTYPDGQVGAGCTLSSEPEPGCAAAPPDSLGLGCFDNDVVICWDGVPAARHTVCGDGFHCSEVGAATSAQFACVAD